MTTQPLPVIHRIEDIAEHFGAPARTVRETAFRAGVLRQIGRNRFIAHDDLPCLMEIMRQCPSKSTSAAKSGTIAGPLPAGSFEDLQKLRAKKPQSVSRRKSKQQHGTVISMDPERM